MDHQVGPLADSEASPVGGKIEGRFVEPTILTGVKPGMKLYEEETFGPVVPVIPFSSDDEAVQIANDAEIGIILDISQGGG